MKRNKVVRKIASVVMASAFMLSLVACEAKHKPVEVPKNSKKIAQDKNYTEDLKKEKAIQNGQVYIQNGTAIATMIIKDDISDKDAKTLAEKYATELKKTYKDMKVNVQAVKKGKNVANIVKE